MTKLLQKAIKPTLKIAISKSNKKITGDEQDIINVFSLLDTQLSLVPGKKETLLHIQANLPNENSEYSFYKLGLFIDYTTEQTGAQNVLLAFYQRETALATKQTNSDIVLDIIVSLTGYKPGDFTIEPSDHKLLFKELPATHERYGTVRLAVPDNIKKAAQSEEFALTTKLIADSEKIKNREAGYLLTSNDLDSLVISTDQGLKTEFIGKNTFDFDANVDSILFSASTVDDNDLHTLLALKTLSSEKLVLISHPWPLKQAAPASRRDINVSGAVSLPSRFIPQTPLAINHDNNGSNDYYFFSDTKQLYRLSIPFERTKANALVRSTLFLSGQLFFYNERVGVLQEKAEDDCFNTGKIILLNNTLTNFEAGEALTYSRNRSLIYVLHDKIYLFGGQLDNANKTPLIEIYHAYRSNQSYQFANYIPTSSPSKLSLSTLNNAIMAHIGHRIYFFNRPNSQEAETLAPNYQIYDSVSHHFTDATFTEKTQAMLTQQFHSVACLSDGKKITLTFLHLANPKTLELSYWAITEHYCQIASFFSS